MNRLSIALSCVVLFYNGAASAFYMDLPTSKKRREGSSIEKNKHHPSAALINQLFSLVEPKIIPLDTDPHALQQAVRDALAFINHVKPIVAAPQPFSTMILSLNKTKETLQFLDQIIEEDKASGDNRLQDPDFLAQHLGFIQWKADRKQAQKNSSSFVVDSKIRLTSYVVYQAQGSYEPTDAHPYPLYQLKHVKETIPLLRQDILNGALESGVYADRVKPLVWVNQETLEEAMMQGTIFITMPDKKVRAFNVSVSNGYKFNHAVKKLSEQQSYWFFCEKKKDEAQTLLKRCKNNKQVVFAGNVDALGVGKIIAIQYRNEKTKKLEMKLGVLGDVGSAFDGNLYQLDLFGGIVNSRAAMKEGLRQFPPTVKAFIVYRKSDESS